MSADYNKYKLEDFLADVDFVVWSLNPDKECGELWNDFARKYPGSGPEFYKAVAVMKNVRLNDFVLTAEEKQSLFGEIICDYKTIRRRTIRNRLVSVAAAAAVIIVALFVFVPRPSAPDSAATVLSAGDIRLISGKETTVIPSESASLEYSGTGAVNVNGKALHEAANDKKRRNNKGAPVMNELIVPAGRRAFVIMADGTKVWVNSGSNLKYPSVFDGNARDIYIDGEIYLEVVKNPAQPFTVHGEEFSTRVLGTSFNVRSGSAAGQSSLVALVEGSVEVTTYAGEKVVMKPSQVMTMKSGGWSVITADVFRYISWKEGLLTFSGDTLERVFSQVSSYYDVEIEYSPAVGAMTCTGKLVLFEDLQTTLDVISEILPINYTMTGNKITIHTD